MRPESWVLSSRENRATGGSPEPGHVTLDDFSCGQETSLALLVRHGDGASAADVIRRFLKPAHDPASSTRKDAHMEALAFAFVPGALWLSSEVSWSDRTSRTNGTGGRRYAAVEPRLGTWHVAWSRRSPLRLGHSQPGRARS